VNPPGPTLDIHSPFCGGKQPLLLLAVAFSCGIVAARFVWHPATDWVIASLLLMAMAALIGRRRPTFAFSIALLSVGMLGGLGYSTRPVRGVSFSHATTEGECNVVAHVVRDGVLQQGMFGGQQQSIDLQTESIELQDGIKFTNPLGLRLSIYARKADYEDEEQRDAGTLPMPLLKYGHRVQLTAKLHEPRNYGNPAAWDYRGYI
jgi:hypothetical protein